jgi:hypothetical protein
LPFATFILDNSASTPPFRGPRSSNPVATHSLKLLDHARTHEPKNESA